MSLLEKLYSKEPIAEIFKAIEETEDFTDCLVTAITNYPNEKKLLALLFTFTEDPKGCLLAAISTRNDELVGKLIAITEDISGCLHRILFYKRVRDRYFWPILEATEDATSSLASALSLDIEEDKIIGLVKKTKNFGKIFYRAAGEEKVAKRLATILHHIPDVEINVALDKMISSKNIGKEALAFLLPRVKETKGALLSALRHRQEDKELISSLIENTKDFTPSILFTLSNPTFTEEFILELIAKAGPLVGIVEACLKFRPEEKALLAASLRKTKVVKGVLEDILAKPGAPQELIFEVLRKETVFGNSLTLAIVNYPGMEDLVSMIYAASGWKKAFGVQKKDSAWMSRELRAEVLRG